MACILGCCRRGAIRLSDTLSTFRWCREAQSIWERESGRNGDDIAGGELDWDRSLRK